MTGLYFPYMNFRELNWAKHSLLFWPSLARIVPDDYRARNEIVDTIKDIMPYFVKEYIHYQAIEQTSEEFGKFIEKNMDFVKMHYSILDKSDSEIDERRLAAKNRNNKKTDVSFLHQEKIIYAINSYLISNGLARRINDHGAGWIAMNSTLLEAYMMLLTRNISEVSGYIPTTDTNYYQSRLVQFQNEDLLDSLILDSRDSKLRRVNGLYLSNRYEQTGNFARYIFKQISLANIEHISLVDIINFRIENERVILAYRSAIKKAIEESEIPAECNDRRALNEWFSDLYRSSVKSAELEFRQAISYSRFEAYAQFATVIISAGNTILNFAGGHYPAGYLNLANTGLQLIKASKSKTKGNENAIAVYTNMIKSFSTRYN